jgi:hypothetical protein
MAITDDLSDTKSRRSEEFWRTYEQWSIYLTYARWAIWTVVVALLIMMGPMGWNLRTRVTSVMLVASFGLMTYGITGLRVKMHPIARTFFILLLCAPLIVQFIGTIYLALQWPPGL